MAEHIPSLFQVTGAALGIALGGYIAGVGFVISKTNLYLIGIGLSCISGLWLTHIFVPRGIRKDKIKQIMKLSDLKKEVEKE